MLNIDEIKALPAGRELDAVVAEVLFGWKCENGAWVNSAGESRYLPNLSKDCSKIEHVLSRIDHDDFHVQVSNCCVNVGYPWCCVIVSNTDDGGGSGSGEMMEAVCKAVLETVLEERKCQSR